MSAGTIRSRAVPSCAVCGGAGETLYENLEDRLFGAPGTWRMVRCTDASCGLLWLDPAPVAEDLGIAYARYYTHESRQPHPWIEALRRWATEGHYSARYGYRVSGSGLKRLLAGVVVRSPELREHLDRRVLLQSPVSGGRALDVGCGEGRTVEAMARLGWDAHGIDFDPRAVDQARRRGLNVRLGAIEEQRYPTSSYDVIGMSHVIEHVPDPLATLMECRRLLRPDGRLVLLTPNAESLGHRRFGRDWRGLEPPRHLNVFTPSALRRLVLRAGLAERSLSSPSLGAAFASAESRRIQGDPTARTGDARARAFLREEVEATAANPWAGEELLLIATAN